MESGSGFEMKLCRRNIDMHGGQAGRRFAHVAITLYLWKPPGKLVGRNTCSSDSVALSAT